MAKTGGAKDYFFSDHLKKGGVSYANMHKEILNNGGDQKKINYLAMMQEKAAGRNPNTIQKAKEGGVRRLQHGGPHSNERTPQLSMQQRMYQQNLSPDDYQSHMQSMYEQNLSKVDESKLVDPNTGRPYSESQAQGASTSTSSNNSKGYKTRSGDPLKVASEGYLPEYGDIPGRQPGVNVGDMQYYLDDPELQQYISEHENFGDEWMKNIDPEVLEAAGIDSYEDLNETGKVRAYQNAWNKKNPENKIQVDGKLGEQTLRTGVGSGKEGEEGDTESKEPETPEITKRKEVINKAPEKDMYGNLIGAAQFLPAVAAYMEKPDYMDSPDLIKPGIVGAERDARVNLERVDYNSDKAAVGNDVGAMAANIGNSGGGSSNIVNQMAAFGQGQRLKNEITSKETNVNTQIGNTEGQMEASRRARNSDRALRASTQNANSIQAASKYNADNKRYVDDFNSAADAATKDRRLMALDTGVKNLAQMRRDKLQYEAQERLASAVSGQSGVYNRELLKKDSLFKKMGGHRHKEHNMANKYSRYQLQPF